MRSTISRGSRRILVTAGVMSLGLSVVAPGTVWAKSDNADPQGEAAQGDVGHGADTASDAGGAVMGHCHLTGNGSGPAIWIPSNDEGIDSGHGEHQGGEHDDAGEPVDYETCVAANGGAPVVTGGNNGNGADGNNGNGADGNNGNGPGGNNGNGADGNNGNGADGNNGNNGNGPDGNNGNGPDGNNGNGPDGNNGNGPDGNNGNGNGAGNGKGNGNGTPAAPAQPATAPATPPAPASPVVDGTDAPRQPRPVIISADGVDNDVDVPAPAVDDEVEVMGVTTTRTPTQEVATGGVQTLPRTGADHTGALVLLGGSLLLAGMGLELASRRSDARSGGQLPSA